MSAAPKYPKRDAVLIVADGPSAAVMRSLQVPQGLYVIAVNAVVHWLPRVDAFITLDPCQRQRITMANQRPGVRYFAAVPGDYGTRSAKSPAHRAPREQGVTFLRRVSGPGPLGSRFGMHSRPDCVSSGNSAWGALNIAHHIGAKRIGLIGVDGNNGPRVSGGRPGPLAHLPALFDSYDGPAEIRNGSIRSAVRCFKKSSASEVLEWLL